MKNLIQSPVAAILAVLMTLSPALAEDPAPIFSGTVKSFDELHKMFGTIVETVAPDEVNPMDELAAMVGDTVDRERPAHLMVWPNGILEPLVAAYIPTDDFDGLKRKLVDSGVGPGVEFEKAGGYLVMMQGVKTSLEENLEAARGISPEDIESERPLEVTFQLDDSTRTMLRGVLAAARLGLMQQSEQFGEGPEAEMMEQVFKLYFDMLDGLVEGMDSTTISLGIVDAGIRTSISLTPKEGTTLAKLVAKSPMDPAPLVKYYQTESLFSASMRIAELDDAMKGLFNEAMALSMAMGGEIDEDTMKSIEGMAEKMAPMYSAFGYDYDGEFSGGGISHFPEGDGASAFYGEMIELSTKIGKQMSGEGKPYKKFSHKRVEKDGISIDQFEYEMQEGPIPDPIFGGKMTMEYALSGKDMLAGIGKEGVAPMLKPLEPVELPEFLTPDETTVMIGHFDILKLVEQLAKVEIAHQIAAKDDIKNAAGDTGGWDKVLMRAAVDGSFHLDLHIPLGALKKISEMVK